MTTSFEKQEENQTQGLIIVLLNYFKKVRKISIRDLASKVHYAENHLTNVRNGDKLGGEKLLHALETFLELDNLKQIQEKQRQIEDLKREIEVLQMQTIETFYAERKILADDPAKRVGQNPELNDRRPEKPAKEPKISSSRHQQPKPIPPAQMTADDEVEQILAQKRKRATS